MFLIQAYWKKGEMLVLFIYNKTDDDIKNSFKGKMKVSIQSC